MAHRANRDQPAAVVIALDSITGLQTARILAGHGIAVAGIARDPRHPACRTNACRRLVIRGTAGDELIAALLDLGGTFESPPVLFPCADLSVLAVSRHRDALAEAYRFVMPAAAVIDTLLDKARFQAYAADAGLPVAATHIIRDRAGAERAAAALRFPCALKPAVKTPAWHACTSAKLFTAANPGQLLDRYDECRTWTDVLIAQEWVHGPDTCNVTCNAYFDAESRPVLTFVSQKLRQWPLEGGVGCLSQECRNDEVLRETVRLFQGAGHHGLAYLEMKRDARTGRYVIIEPNVGRPTGRSAAADAAGVQLLYTQYCDALDLPLPPAGQQQHRGAKWIHFRRDCQSAYRHWRNGVLGPGDWARTLRGCRHDAVFSWRDPRPFVADVALACRKALRPAAPLRQVQMPTHTDFDVHGIVGLRLLGARPSEVAAVERQIGPFQTPLRRTPDIVVQFVDELPIEGLRWIEFGRTGYTDDGFFVVTNGKRPVRVRMKLDEIGGRCEIVCQHGLRSVPLLMALVTVAALSRGYVPLHGSAFVYNGTGVLVTGWARGGKTEALLAFAAHGAEYIGDEWILLGPDGRSMHGIPEFIRLQDWHFERLQLLRRHLRLSKRLFFKSIRLLENVHRHLGAGWARRFPMTWLGEALPALKRQLNVQLDPLALFGRGPGGFTGAPDKVFFMVSHDATDVRVERADPEDIARRMTASIAYEQLPLTSTYLAYQFAYPGRRSKWFDRAAAVQSETLVRALAGKDAYVVRHPYPCDLDELFHAMAPACDRMPTLVPLERVAERQATRSPHAETTHA